MPWISPLGGTYEVRWNQMTSGELFEVGEPVAIIAAGTLTEPPDNAGEIILGDHCATGELGGIACFGPGAGNIDPRTGAAFAALGMIAYWPWNQGTLFITENFFAAGAAADVAMLLTDIGVVYQVTYNTTATIGWGVEQTAGVPGTDLCARVQDVLDADKVPIRISGGTGAYMIFDLTTSA
jgi:hypothetical protein